MTIHNLIVVSMEKYAAHVLCLHSSQNDLFSWLSGFVVTLAPAATFTEMKYNRNETHFTVICVFHFRVLSMYSSQYFSGFHKHMLGKNCLELIGRVSSTCRGNNPLKAKMKSTTCIGCEQYIPLLQERLHYVILYSAFISYSIFNTIAKPNVSFETDFLIRHRTSGLLAIFNSAINVVIYFVQMKDFRLFLLNMFCVGSGR